MPYDTEKDLAPVSIAGQVPMLLVSHPSLPFERFQGFVDYARKNPASSTLVSRQRHAAARHDGAADAKSTCG